MSRFIVLDRFGGPEVLQIADSPVSAPAAGEVQIRVEAFAINPIDLMVRAGHSPAPVALPGRLGVEATGIVEAVGAGVAAVAIGDAVIVVAVPDAAVNGAYAEHLVVPVDRVIRRPGEFDATEAAAVWVGFATAYGALVEKAGMRPGDRVLINAPWGSVGRAAIQVAAYLGAVPIALTRDPRRAEGLRAVGAAEVLTEATTGLGADIVLDLVAGPAQADLVAAARPGATVVAAGFLDPRPATLPFAPVTIHRYASFSHVVDPQVVSRMAAVLQAGARFGAFRPAIGRVFPFEAVADAHRHAETAGGGGKTVVAV